MSSPSPLFSVAGKNVLVTGGSRGIGYMIARGFRERGADVLIASRNEEACTEAAASLNCRHVASDASTRRGCEALARHASDVFGGRLDVLVNNAGASWGEPPDRDSESNWGFDKVFDLNVKGIFYLTRACLPLLEKSATAGDGAGVDDPARVINVGSVAGLVPQGAPTHAYDASKAAVHHLTRKLAADLAPRRVTVNAVAPGFVPTKMSAGLSTWGGDAERLASHVPLGRMGDGDDMTGACVYLASRAGAWVTGVVLAVDGGTVGAMQIPLSSL